MSYLLAVETEVQRSSVDFGAAKGATVGFAPRTLASCSLSPLFGDTLLPRRGLLPRSDCRKVRGLVLSCLEYGRISCDPLPEVCGDGS